MKCGTLVVRQVKPGGGKGALFAEGRAQCLGTGSEQTLIVDRWREMESYGINPQGGQMLPFDRECGETLAIGHGGGVMQLNDTDLAAMRYIVRRLTPMECERLQGLPDRWTIPAFRTEQITDALVAEFVEIHNTFARIMAEYAGKKPPKLKTAKQVRKWLEKIANPATCPYAPRYKACGNGWATNQPRWILLRLLDADISARNKEDYHA